MLKKLISICSLSVLLTACPKAVEEAAEDVLSGLLTPSATPTRTYTPTPTLTHTPTPTSTATATHTPADTPTALPTRTPAIAPPASPSPPPFTATPLPEGPGGSATPTPQAPAPGPRITWLYSSGNARVGQWPVTSGLRVEFRNGNICLRYDKRDTWPSRTINGVEVNANPWVIGQIGGQYYGATWEWFRPGQQCKPAWKVEGAHIKQPRHVPLHWRPKSGDRLGFMVSCLARTRQARNCQERTEIAWVTWP